jgi:hypothetical protein
MPESQLAMMPMSWLFLKGNPPRRRAARSLADRRLTDLMAESGSAALAKGECLCCIGFLLE